MALTATLYFYKAPKGNFGDDLNIWLWPKILEDFSFRFCYHGNQYFSECEKEESLLVGIGTILDNRIPRRPQKIICGAGAGYNARPIVDQSWKVAWVRGPKTASLLGVSPELAITDTAALVTKVVGPLAPGIRKRFGFMPHHETAGKSWQRVCDHLGFRYLDPRSTVDDVIQGMRLVDVVLAEAMHGAIVADALRIPWIALRSHPGINEFKWQDWTASLNLDYDPHKLPALWPVRSAPVSRLKSRIKEELVIRRLKAISDRARPRLSSDDIFFDKLNELDAAVLKISDYLAAKSK